MDSAFGCWPDAHQAAQLLQQKLAEALLDGVRAYLGQLNRDQATRLGAKPGARVAAKGRSKR